MSTRPSGPGQVPQARGVAQGGIRVVNERTILTLLSRNPGASNAVLARLSGLGAQTTSRILSQLEVRGLILRGEAQRGRRGQPAIPIFLDPEAAFGVGIEVGWEGMAVVLVDFTGRLRSSVSRAYAYPDARTLFEELDELVRILCNSLPSELRERVGDIGLAAPPSLGRNIALFGAPAEQARLWSAIDLQARLGEALGRRVTWVNDGNAACWAQYVALPQPRPQSLVCFYVSSLIGAGLIAEGALWEGPSGNAADLGSIMVSDRQFRPTFVHNIASLWALKQLLASDGLRPPEGPALEWDWPALEPDLTQWLDEAGRALAKAMMTVQALVEVDGALLDGTLPPSILARLGERTRHHLAALPEMTRDKPEVHTGRLGEFAPAIGAAQMSLFRTYFSRDWSQLSIG